ncbi:hypothetical protein ABZ078_26140 [Streptomyces sp. NPDC006385]|uniref:hypothetical protein n=1 Tax=Streptomyces sp. NPDC006385 TaxID=3156761 RepID=UPI0033A57807
MTTQTATESGTVGEDGPATARLFGPRGRHRRPRPRKALLAAGGLALAAGALSLLRLTPDSDVTTLGTAESDPAPVSGTDTETDRSTNAAATVPTRHPKASPTATSAMGGAGTAPTTATVVVPTGNTTAEPRPGGPATTTGESPARTPAPAPPAKPTHAPDPAKPEPPAPAPDQTPTNPPAPQPDQPDQPDDGDVCLPVIGLCVDPPRNAD